MIIALYLASIFVLMASALAGVSIRNALSQLD